MAANIGEPVSPKRQTADVLSARHSVATTRSTQPAQAAGSGLPAWTRAELGPAEFGALVDLVSQSCGISLSPAKRTMLQTRLRKRLQVNGLSDFPSYLALLKSEAGRTGEMQSFIDSVVTNETSFFREKNHFSFLAEQCFDALVAANRTQHLAIWSAACSYGEEVYTAAMVADEVARRSGWRYSVLGTDISIKALRRARNATYRAEALAAIPSTYRRYVRNVEKGGENLIEITPELRESVQFGQLNLMHGSYRPGRTMDVIFCRNTLIYFEPRDQHKIIAQLCRHLRPGGLLVLGHADASPGNAAPLKLLGNNIYEHKGA